MMTRRSLMLKPRIAVVTLVAVLLAGCATAGSSAAVAPTTAIDGFLSAMENADAEAMAALFAEDATVFMPFDAVPRRLVGREEIRSVFARFFEGARKSAAGPPYMKLNPVDIHTQQFGDTAIITFHLGRVPDAAATSPSSFSRRTFVMQRQGDRWVVRHLHASNMRLEPPKPE
jgi:uncharacterized protein (TIGR02246 family)